MDAKFTVNIHFFKIAIWLTLILGVLKIANILDISNWLVFMPLIVASILFILIFFFIGLIVVYYIVTHYDELTGSDVEPNEEQNETTD